MEEVLIFLKNNMVGFLNLFVVAIALECKSDNTCKNYQNFSHTSEITRKLLHGFHEFGAGHSNMPI